jgi:hypothetical protein
MRWVVSNLPMNLYRRNHKVLIAGSDSNSATPFYEMQRCGLCGLRLPVIDETQEQCECVFSLQYVFKQPWYK